MLLPYNQDADLGGPLVLFYDINFRLINLKCSEGVFGVNYTNFEVERKAKKTQLLVKYYEKLPKNGFLTCLF